ncbi:2,3-bisphosphoglycerate-independent phosphoglycerate mutase [Paracoccaceae bacterium GXU_MW_L88]
MTQAKKPVVLTILDGWGLEERRDNNAPALAETPTMDRIWADYPHETLTTFGNDVGLPEGQMGNSEVGHTNIGAGRVVWMDLPKIDNAIEDGSLAANEALDSFAAKVKAAGGVAHLCGLASPGGVHSHQRHIAALAGILVEKGLKVRIHAFTDGRDVAPKSAVEQVGALEADLPAGARIATVSGRFYAMDRDNRWERVQAATDAILRAEGSRAESARKAIEAAHASDETDEFITPAIIGDYAGAKDGDGLIFANFRADRARQILAAMAQPEFDAAEIPGRVAWSSVLGMVEYSTAHNAYMDVIFPSEDIPNTLGAYVAEKGRTQFRLAETEKYPHVTFFLNGGVENPSDGEKRYMAPSPKVRTYDMQPEMSAAEVGDQLEQAIRSGDYDLIVVNFANPDMVGHTGDLGAAIKACEAVDHELGRALRAIEEIGGAMVVIADHGNCDIMVDPVTGNPHTAHTTNPVPCVVIGAPDGARVTPGGKLADVAPTLLALMGLEKPAEMTGRNLLD